MVERLNGIQEVAGSTPTISTKKGLSEHCCFKKRYSDSFYFTKRMDAMKSVLFSYIIHYPFLFAFRWGYLHRKITGNKKKFCRLTERKNPDDSDDTDSRDDNYVNCSDILPMCPSFWFEIARARQRVAVDRQFATRQILAEGLPLAGYGKLSKSKKARIFCVLFAYFSLETL